MIEACWKRRAERRRRQQCDYRLDSFMRQMQHADWSTTLTASNPREEKAGPFISAAQQPSAPAALNVCSTVPLIIWGALFSWALLVLRGIRPHTPLVPQYSAFFSPLFSLCRGGAALLGGVKDAVLPSIEVTEVDSERQREAGGGRTVFFRVVPIQLSQAPCVVELNRSATLEGLVVFFFRECAAVCLFVCLVMTKTLRLLCMRPSAGTVGDRRKRRTFNNSLNRRCSGRVGLIMQNHDLPLKETFSKNLLPMSR